MQRHGATSTVQSQVAVPYAPFMISMSHGLREARALLPRPQRRSPRPAQTTDVPLLYDAADLVTHAVILGMTGSGKTGLGIGLIEEAAIDGMPVLADRSEGRSLEPAADVPRACSRRSSRRGSTRTRRGCQGVSAEAFAEREAARWREGLAEWGQAAIASRGCATRPTSRVYTPGSRAARPLSILRTFAGAGRRHRERSRAARRARVGRGHERADARRRRRRAAAQPRARPRVDAAQRGVAQQQSLDLPSLIAQVQSPPVQRDRRARARVVLPRRRSIQARVRSQSAAGRAGLRGVARRRAARHRRAALHRRRASRASRVLSIAHLDDRERMFFVSLLLNEVVAWVRVQRGTSTLRAMVYIDEMIGFLPPVAMPPSKPPLLTLLKQARAFGLGMTLATQNPVDLDYKALSNAGTWFLGRLQTERDKARLLDGLEGADAASATASIARPPTASLSGLEKRTFLLHNVHDSQPVLFKTRWTLSYLRGPLGREELAGWPQAAKPRQGALVPRVPGCRGAGAAGAVPKCRCWQPCWNVGTAGTARTACTPAPAHQAPQAPPAPQAPSSFQRPLLDPAIPQFFAPGTALPLGAGAPWRRARRLLRRQARLRRGPRHRRRRTIHRRRRSQSIGSTPSRRPSRLANSRGNRSRPPRSSRCPRARPRRRSTPSGRKDFAQWVGPVAGGRVVEEARGRNWSPPRTRASATFASASRPRCASSVTPRSPGCASDTRRGSQPPKTVCDAPRRPFSASRNRPPSRRCRPACRWRPRSSARSSVARPSAPARSAARRRRRAGTVASAARRRTSRAPKPK